jgi:hypothetical protein
MTTTITAKTKRGAASQIAKAIRREAVRVMGMTAQEAEDFITLTTLEWTRPTAPPDTSYEIIWECSSPYEWAMIATGGGNIWEDFAPGDGVICGAPTLKMPAYAKWVAEPSTGFSISIWDRETHLCTWIEQVPTHIW